MLNQAAHLSKQLALPAKAVSGCLQLLDEGNTIPFIARYRKEQTGSLDEVQIRAVEDAYTKLKELEARRQTVLKTIADLGKLTDELRRQIELCTDRQQLEDLYQPYKPSRKTRAAKAREAGLEPLAEMMQGKRRADGPRMALARRFIAPDKGVKTADDALAGARDIVAEEVISQPASRGEVRQFAARTAKIMSRKKRGSGDDAEIFRDYHDHDEQLNRIPSHRFLAIQRGEQAGALSVSLDVDADRGLSMVRRDHLRKVPEVFRSDFIEAVEDGWKRLLWPAIQRELLALTKERSDRAAVAVFEKNLRSLLMDPPARGRNVLAIDPGFRNGCKMAVVDTTGKVLGTGTIYPHPPQQQRAEASQKITSLVTRHRVTVVAVGDGTAHRETMSLMQHLDLPGEVSTEAVREAGASVYSASELAGQELPDLDVTIRGAVSIARRYQDPLAELVKIDPRSIGVGQYQHDVDEKLLARGLDAVVEECVNRVGVELNTASPALLARVAGVGPKLASAIVDYREQRGAFARRQEILKVPGLGPAKFTQCGGFLRLHDGAQPLDATGIHPERYQAINKVVKQTRTTLSEIIGDKEAAQKLHPLLSVLPDLGSATITDIIEELARPGHDPRGERQEFRFAEDIHSIEDLKVGMILPGRVTSVTDFGAFIDLGVHRNGLVHISKLADRRVASPFEICQPQQSVTVRVMEVDIRRQRISLSMKQSDLEG